MPPGTLYDAIYRVITKDFADAKGRKAIIILSDGFEAGKKISHKEIVETLIESDTVLYPVIFQIRGTAAYFPPNTKSITREQLLSLPGIDYLNGMSVSTGGRVVVADTRDFSTAFQNIADELRKQYVIGFYPTNAEGGRSANITIKVNRDGAVVRSKKTIRLKPRNTDVPKSSN